MKIAVFGDSHSVFNFAAYPQVDIYWLGPVTMHRVGRDGLRSLLTYRGGFLPWSRDKLRRYDIVLASFGEIDCRAHVEKIAVRESKPLERVIDDLVTRYIAALKSYFAGYRGRLIILCVPPSAPTTATLGQVSLRVKLNRKLQSACSRENITFLDYWPEAPATDGIINEGWHDNNQHFDPAKTGFLRAAFQNRLTTTLTFAPTKGSHFARTKGEQTLLGRARMSWRTLRTRLGLR